MKNRLDKYVNTATPESFNDPDAFQVRLAFGDHHELSIVKHTGSYGNKSGLYEIGVFVNGEFANMPGITEDHDTVKGWLSKDEVDGIIVKMFTITGKDPVQITG